MEMLYVQIFLNEGGARAWSSLRGELDVSGFGWQTVFSAPGVQPVEREAKVMIHLLGDYDLFDEEKRGLLLHFASRAGYGVARIIENDPLLEPEEAFALLLSPFT